MCVCVCGLDQPPEFSLQLWEVGGKKKKRKMKEGEIKSDREEIKDLKAIDFLLSGRMCLFILFYFFF